MVFLYFDYLRRVGIKKISPVIKMKNSEDKEEEEEEEMQEDIPEQEAPDEVTEAAAVQEEEEEEKKQAEEKAEEKKKIPKKYEKTTCPKCNKTMSLNTFRYKHQCPEAVLPKAKAKAKAVLPKAVPKKQAPPKAPRPAARMPIVEEASPRTRLRDLYREVRIQQLEKKRSRWAGIFD